jgi:hypothetical protein
MSLTNGGQSQRPARVGRGEANMLRNIALAGVFSILIALPVLADDHRGGDDHHGGGNSGHSAPEPLTMIGLGVGGASVAFAGWKKRRGKR